MLNNTSNEKSFTKKSFITVFTETYPLYNESGSKPLTEEDYEYVSQPLVAVTSFFNLPNHKRLSKELSFFDVLKNVIHWDVENEKNKKMGWTTIPLAIPRTMFHLAVALLVLPSSTAKLITELLPGLAEEYCYIGKTQTKSNYFLQSAYKIGHFISSGVHFVGQLITPSIKGFFPSLRGESGIGKLLKSAFVYYGLLALLGTASLIALTVIAFKLPTLAFVGILIAEAGLIAYAGHNIYKGCFTAPNPLQPIEHPQDEAKIVDSLAIMSTMMPAKPKVEQSYFNSLYNSLFACTENEKNQEGQSIIEYRPM
ncbi:MAG: hypothetical protein P4L79_12345 [Legionella sp.]|uniref:hypothetical protein n=1 Tax=Legionella sp. TaxID=459 RepID=UPI002849017C|nr:hypothetical protein [Legionella sp.]